MRLSPRAHALALALSLPLVASSARADDSDVCRRARVVLGTDAAEATAVQCQAALDEREEEEWQLTLDMALASEKTGDKEQAVARYQRFVDAADRRGARLSESWAHLRDEARTAIGRIDQELLQKGARVNISTIPEGAEVTVVSGVVVPGDTQKTPTIRYFAAGSHTVRVRAADGQSRELSFTVERGQTLELKIDLRKGAPTEHGVIEGTGPAMRGQTPGPETNGNGPVIDNGAVIREPLDGDDNGPPQTETMGSTGTTIGMVAVSVGVASLAAGSVFLLTANGLDDEFERCADPRSGCTAVASELNAVEHDADVQYDRATVAFIAGGALVVGGIIAVLVFDDVGVVEPSGSGTTITPWVAPEGGGVSASLRF